MPLSIKILFPCILFSISLAAQKKKPKIQPVGPPFYIEVKVTTKDRIPVTNYSNVVLYDCRIDSFRTGQVWIEFQKGPQEIRFMGGMLNYLQGRLNKIAAGAPEGQTLHVVLRDLAYREGITQGGWFESAILGSSEKTTSQLHYYADLFLSAGNSVQKIGTIDTVFSAMRWMPDNADKLTERMLKHTIHRGGIIDSSVIENLTIAQFDSIRSGPFFPPVVLAKEHPKGVFFSFEQFLNNIPTDTSFEYKSAGNGVTLQYRNPADTTEDLAWGFSDGNKLYIHVDSFYYQLKESGKYYEVTAPETIEIVNRFSSKVVTKALNVASLYFIYASPFKVFSLLGLSSTIKKWVPELRTYELCIYNGRLR